MDIVAPLNKRVNLIQLHTEARLHDGDVPRRPAIVSAWNYSLDCKKKDKKNILMTVQFYYRSAAKMMFKTISKEIFVRNHYPLPPDCLLASSWREKQRLA